MSPLVRFACLVAVVAADPARAADPLPTGAIRAFGTDRFLTWATPITFTPDGKTLVGFSRTDEVCTWDSADGRLLRRQRVPASGYPRQFLSADGRLAAFLGNPREHFVVWDLAAGKELHRFKTEAPWSYHDAVFVTGDKYLVTAENNSRENNRGVVKRWSLADGSCKTIAEEPFYFTQFAVSPDGKRFAASTNLPRGGQVRCWDAESGEALWTADYEGTFLTFTSDGSALIGAPYRPPRDWRAWDAATGKPATGLRLPTAPVSRSEMPILRAAGPLLLFAGEMKTGLVAWDLAAGKEVRKFGVYGAPAAVSPDGKSVLTLQPRWQRWDMATGAKHYPDIPLGNLSTHWVRIGPDGRSVAAINSHYRLTLLDTKTGQMTAPEDCAVTAVAFTADGRRVATARRGGPNGLTVPGTDEYLVVRDLPGGKISKMWKLPAAAYDLAVTPDGKRAVAACWQSGEKEQASMVTLELDSGRELARGPRVAAQLTPRLSADGRRAVIADSTFDVGRGEAGHKLIPTDFFWLSAPTALSPDGRYFAIHALEQPPVTEKRDYVVVVLEYATGRPVAVLKTGAIGQIAFDLSRGRLVTADWEGVRAWDLATAECRLHHKPHALWASDGRSLLDVPDYRKLLHQSNGVFAGALDVAPDGTFAVTGHPDTRVFVWDLAPARSPAVPAPAPTAWVDLVSEAGKAYRTVRSLAAHPDAALTLFKDRLRSAEAVDPAHIRRLIDQLDAPAFRAREAAQVELIGLGRVVLGPVQEALKRTASAEQLKRLEAVAAMVRVPTPVGREELRRVRVVEVLERIGTPTARRVLEELATGTESSAGAAEARAALDRLGAPR